MTRQKPSGAKKRHGYSRAINEKMSTKTTFDSHPYLIKNKDTETAQISTGQVDSNSCKLNPFYLKDDSKSSNNPFLVRVSLIQFPLIF